MHNTNDSNRLLLANKINVTIKEIFDIRSKNGIQVAGRTIKLDKI